MTTATVPTTTTSPTGNAILVLSNYYSDNKPFIVDFNGYYHILIRQFKFILGNINEDLAFEYGDRTSVTRGCAATLKNEFWYFGGQGGSYGEKDRQVRFQNHIGFLCVTF